MFSFRDQTPPDKGMLKRMANAMAHRGPDDQGVESGGGWGLASSRLAIIGLGTGHMPMANEDGAVWAVFNGEIYNHRALREDLTSRGHQFRTEADTEVLVHLYEEHGDAMAKYLDGMFAFAIVDTRSECLFLARDRFGQKPLFYHISRDGELVFASELLALLQFPGIPRDIDRQAVYDYLSLSYIPTPRSIYRTVRKLPPAHTMLVRRGSGADEPSRYWRINYGTNSKISFRDATTRTRELLDQAVVARLESEVPLGAFLSGGIDSTVVTAIMQRNLSEPVKTFTIGFEDARYDEREFAKIAANSIGTEHHMRIVSPGDLDLLTNLIPHYGEPFCDSSMLPTAMLSRFTHEHVTVALSGDAGDELFGGYRRYSVMDAHRRMRCIPAPLRNAVCGLLLHLLPENREQRTRLATVRRLLRAFQQSPLDAYTSFQEVCSEELKQELVTEPGSDYRIRWAELLDERTTRSTVERFLELDTQTYLPDDLLVKVDIASMASSLEVRSPFLDHHLVEHVASLPRHYKVGMYKRKRLLKELGKDLTPDRLLKRGKRGFGVPIARWLRHDWRETTEALASEHGNWDTEGLLDGAVVSRLVREHVDGVRDHSFRLWALLCLRLWCDKVHNSPAAPR